MLTWLFRRRPAASWTAVGQGDSNPCGNQIEEGSEHGEERSEPGKIESKGQNERQVRLDP
jgi:hypothetical protein